MYLKLLKKTAYLYMPFYFLFYSYTLFAEEQVFSHDKKFLGEVIEEGILSFKGIRYAKPPINKNRWKPPQDIKIYDYPIQANKFGNACMQTNRLTIWSKQNVFINGGDVRNVVDDLVFDEDCLFLNVWTPSAEKNKKLPIMFFIHGGSNRSGSGHDQQLRNGIGIAKKGVILVTINYRHNIFGFLTHEGLNAENENNTSGNYAILDQIKALEWIRSNASSFGGDPENITIFGQSAGGRNILGLLISPLAKGLFDKAIIQGIGIGGIKDFDTTLKDHMGLMDILFKKYPETSNLEKIEILRTMPADKLFNWYLNSGGYSRNIISGLVNDGYVFNTKEILRSKLNTYKIIIGHNSEEWGNFALTNRENYKQNYTNVEFLPPNIQNLQKKREVKSLFRGYPNNFSKWEKYGTAVTWSCSINKFTSTLAQDNNTIYQYVFSHKRPSQDKSWGTGHSFELPYIFGNVEGLPMAKSDYIVEDLFQSYWTNFAKYGNPNSNELPEWKPSNKESAFLDIDKDPLMSEGFDQEICDTLGYWN